MTPSWMSGMNMASVFWLGLLTSLSPCALTMNVVAISFIARHVQSTTKAIVCGLFYAAGNAIAYLALAMLLVSGLTSAPVVSDFLQSHLNQILGPVLILGGMFLLDWLSIPLPSFSLKPQTQERLGRQGYWSAGVLGFVFALSFCPVTAGLFFGGLIPLLVKQHTQFSFLFIYIAGTSLPVIAMAILISKGAQTLGIWLNRLQNVEKWITRATGIIFILVGIRYCLVYLLELKGW